MKKVLYLTVPSFFDLEISLIRELSNYCDVRVLMIVSPESKRSSAFEINELKSSPGIYQWESYLYLQKYSKLIETQRWLIANNPDNSIHSCWKLASIIKKFIQEEKFDLIHSTTDCKTSLLLVPFLWRFKKTLYTTHDPFPHQQYSRLRKWLSYDLMFLTYKNLLLLSRSLEADFKKVYQGKYKHIYYSKLGVYDFLQSFNGECLVAKPYILFFGRIDYYKGVDILVRAYQNSFLPKQGIKLVIAGKGDVGVVIEKNNNNIILYNRYIDNSELASLICNSQFVVLPYRTVTQSGVLKSAYAFNKPVVATRTGDFSDEIRDNEGILVEPSNADSLKEGIERMTKSNLYFYSKNISNRYTADGLDGWKHIAHDLVNDVYKDILKTN